MKSPGNTIMEVKVYSFDKFIGTADLTLGDASMGHLYGEFIPTEAYYKEVQPSVWKIYNTINNNGGYWELLHLTAKNFDGVIISASGGITICDTEELPNEPKQIDIAGVHLQTLKFK